MKPLPQTLLLWLILGGLSGLLITESETGQVLVFCAVFILPGLAAWLTIKTATEVSTRWIAATAFWTGTLAAWLSLEVIAQGRAESHPGEQQTLWLALVAAVFVAGATARKTRSFPNWRIAGQIALAFTFLALAGALSIWTYEAQTRNTVAKAKAHWAQIGLPLENLPESFPAPHENSGSEILRQVLRERVNSRFYKQGTAAAEREPVIQPSEEIARRVEAATKFPFTGQSLSDHLVLHAATEAPFEPLAADLDADYRRILAAEVPTWASDLHDGYAISVPSFLGVRHFAQLTAAHAACRVAMGDQEGAKRALDASLRIRDGLLENPTLVSLMIGVAIDGLTSYQQVRLPAQEGDLAAIAVETTRLRTELLRRLQVEGWACIKSANHPSDFLLESEAAIRILPRWASSRVGPIWFRRQCAIGSLSGAAHAAIVQAPSTLELPDLGARQHAEISAENSSVMEFNAVRAMMRIHATLLLREQIELIRDARTRFADGRPTETYNSVVLPGVRWELEANREKGTVATHLQGAPDWIRKNEVTSNEFWVLPLDGSAAWQFPRPALSAN